MTWIMELKSNDWIAIVNALATLFLSYFVYKSTNKAAEASVKTAELTEESIALSKLLNEIKSNESESYRKSLRYQYIKIMYQKADDILKAITFADGREIFKRLKELDYKHNISPENLALCFGESDVICISDTWDTFESYLRRNFRDDYIGDDMQILAAEVGSSIDRFTNLMGHLHNLKKEIDH